MARLTINGWVAERTEDKIRDLIAPDVLTSDTRLVLTNAIYFNASWANPFEEADTEEDDFTRLDGSELTVPMMNQTAHYFRGAGDGWEAISLPYVGNQLSMLVILPEEGRFEEIESGLDRASVDAIAGSLAWTNVELTVPRFRMESEFSLSDALAAQGMPIAFDPVAADFGAMAELRPPDNLYISAVIHKAFVAVDETGTEAAAATAVIISITSSAEPRPDTPVPFKADRPFIVIIRDDPTGSILFMGRLMNPAP